MELHAEDRPIPVADRRDGTVVGPGQWNERRRKRLHHVAVTHPDVRVGGDVGEQAIWRKDLELRPPILPCRGHVDFRSQQAAGDLHAVTDPEHRHPHLQEGGVALGCFLLIHAGRPAREDQADRVQVV